MADDAAAAAGLDAVIDTTVSHSARIWNYWLGGKDNFAADRAAGDRVAAMLPSIVAQARADRAFLGRAIRYLAGEEGIRQFLDIGTGLPTADNTHEVAQRVAPGSRIVTEYYKASGLLEYLAELGFNIVGYGCTTCIGNSGPLPEPVSAIVRENNLIVASVLSGKAITLCAILWPKHSLNFAIRNPKFEIQSPSGPSAMYHSK